jgi:hypothetical protein
MPPLSSAIFIRSYWKDLDWLELCLRAIAHHCRGFKEVVVALPEASRPWLVHRPLPSDVRMVYVKNCADDYLGQQVSKLYADQFIDADFIVHVDADCMFKQATCPELLLPDGRPRIYTRPIAELGRHYPWRLPTEAFLGEQVALDFMQQPPFIYPRWLYPALRRYCVERHGMELDDYVLSRPARGFSEFNVLGGYALRHHPAEFSFPPMVAPQAADACCDWYWSWGGLTPEIRRRIAAHLTASGQQPEDALRGVA